MRNVKRCVLFKRLCKCNSTGYDATKQGKELFITEEFATKKHGFLMYLLNYCFASGLSLLIMICKKCHCLNKILFWCAWRFDICVVSHPPQIVKDCLCCYWLLLWLLLLWGQRMLWKISNVCCSVRELSPKMKMTLMKTMWCPVGWPELWRQRRESFPLLLWEKVPRLSWVHLKVYRRHKVWSADRPRVVTRFWALIVQQW